MVHRVHTGYFLGKYGEKYEGREGGRDRFFFVRFFDILKFTICPFDVCT